MTIKFWDKTQLVVTLEQWQSIKHQRDVLKVDWIIIGDPNNPIAEFHPKTIAAVVKGGLTEADVVKPSHQLPARATMTDEQRAKNRETIARLKREFMARKTQKTP